MTVSTGKSPVEKIFAGTAASRVLPECLRRDKRKTVGINSANFKGLCYRLYLLYNKVIKNRSYAGNISQSDTHAVRKCRHYSRTVGYHVWSAGPLLVWLIRDRTRNVCDKGCSDMRSHRQSANIWMRGVGRNEWIPCFGMSNSVKSRLITGCGSEFIGQNYRPTYRST